MERNFPTVLKTYEDTLPNLSMVLKASVCLVDAPPVSSPEVGGGCSGVSLGRGRLDHCSCLQRSQESLAQPGCRALLGPRSGSIGEDGAVGIALRLRSC